MNRDHGSGDAMPNRVTGDDTYPGCEIGGDELEFLSAIDQYKVDYRRKFLTNTELLAILKGLGYRKEK